MFADLLNGHLGVVLVTEALNGVLSQLLSVMTSGKTMMPGGGGFGLRYHERGNGEGQQSKNQNDFFHI